jgi:hypothetical protein
VFYSVRILVIGIWCFFGLSLFTTNFVYHLNVEQMLRLLTLVFFITITSTAYSQASAVHEPTSATDAEVKLHNGKKSRFHKSTRARQTERITDTKNDSKTRSEVRQTERHGKSVKRSRGTRRLDGEARVFRKHGHSASSTSTKKAKARRAVGKAGY